MESISQRYGAGRVIEPAGSLPQAARRLDSNPPLREGEFSVAVERLCLDSTSFASLHREAAGDPEKIASRIEEIVKDAGKMHNPVTGSGGVLVGTVAELSPGLTNPPEVGRRLVTLASLTMTALTLEEVGPVDPESAQIPVVGTAFIPFGTAWGYVPDDIPLDVVLETYDVFGAASHTRDLSNPGDTVLVMGAGHAGRLALAAAKEKVGPEGRVVAVDIDTDALARAEKAGLCDIAVRCDLRNPIESLKQLRSVGVEGADLTVVVVNATNCETAAILATLEGGTLLFFSMATSFTAAALSADGMAHDIRMLIGSGYAPDRGSYALDLVRNNTALREAIGTERLKP